MLEIDPAINSTEFCDWRVQSQGNCQGVTYVSFLYTTHIISSFLFLFISVGILIHNIWWKGQKIWEFSRNDRAFRPRPTEGFVFWCTGYFFCKKTTTHSDSSFVLLKLHLTALNSYPNEGCAPAFPPFYLFSPMRVSCAAPCRSQ